MLEGWYCRTLANEQAAATAHHDDDENEPNVGDSGSDESQEGAPNRGTLNRSVDYKEQYKYLKQKLKFLLYENEFFQDALRTCQRRLLKVSRDRTFLVDRLLQYEKPEASSSESEETESSDESSKVETKKRKHDSSQTGNKNHTTTTKKKKISQQKQKSAQSGNQPQSHQQQQIQEGHMTAEEVERHLQSRQSITELMPEKAPPTVPTEMFSNEPSLDSESNDQMIETSPSNVGEDCVSVDMNIKSEYNIKTEFPA